MNHDTVSAALWALSSFDPALVHLAELREKFAHLNSEEDPIRITCDRLISVYVEGQCQELLNGAGITTEEANTLVEQRLGNIDQTATHTLDTSGGDPLAMELFGYALWFGVLTAHGTAPWRRFAAVMADCYHQRHPSLAAK